MSVSLFATSAVPHLYAQSTVYGWTADRVWASATALLALAAVVVAGLAWVRSNRRAGAGRKGAVVALSAGLLAVVNGALVVLTADGGPGTGNGIVGGYLAIVIGLVAVLLGGLVLTRTRRGAAV